jgi:phage terminase Nu1 subunit (DNA packaging protein)
VHYGTNNKRNDPFRYKTTKKIFKIMNTTNYKVADIADALQLSARRVQQLVREGILPAPVDGKYNLSVSIKNYGQYLAERQLNKNSSITALAIERLRLLKAQAEKAELELEVLKEKYLEASEVEFTWSDMVLTFRSRMLAIPSKLVRSLAAACGDFAKIQKILEDEIYDALTELSKSDDEEHEDKA